VGRFFNLYLYGDRLYPLDQDTGVVPKFKRLDYDRVLWKLNRTPYTTEALGVLDTFEWTEALRDYEIEYVSKETFKEMIRMVITHGPIFMSVSHYPKKDGCALELTVDQTTELAHEGLDLLDPMCY
jgi:hypothetical protein